jgi:hypothetical protein
VQLGGDEVRCSLNAHAEGKNTSLAVVWVLRREVLAKVLEEGDDNLRWGQARGKDIKESKSGTSRGDVLVLAGEIAELGDDVEGLESELLTNLQRLNLELPVTNTLHQERKCLRSVVLLNIGGRGEFQHEPDEITKVLLQQGRLAAKKGLKDFESLHGTILIALIDGGLEDFDHAGDCILEHGKGLGVLIRLQEHSQAAQTEHGINSDLGTLRVLDGGLEELVQVGVLSWESIASGLECGPDDVCADFPVAGSLAGGGLVQVAWQIGPLAILEVLRCNGRNDAGSRVPGQCVVLVQSELEKLVAERAFLVRWQVGPVLGDELPGLDGRQLAELRLGVTAKDLKEGIERGWGVVVVLVKGRRGRLDTLRVGWTTSVTARW